MPTIRLADVDLRATTRPLAKKRQASSTGAPARGAELQERRCHAAWLSVYLSNPEARAVVVRFGVDGGNDKRHAPAIGGELRVGHGAKSQQLVGVDSGVVVSRSLHCRLRWQS
jgi:hypothetical protein